MSRILLLMQSMTGIGGTERMVAALTTLLGEDHEVHVAAFDPPGAVPHFALTAPFHPLGQDKDHRLPLRWMTYRAQARALRVLKRRIGVDITISNLWRADLINILSGGDDRKIALAHINVVGNPTNRALLRVRPLVAMVYRRFDQVVAVSAALARELTDLYGLRADRVAGIDNFVALPAISAPVAAGPRARLVWCGRFVPEKNTAVLVDILARIKAAGRAVQLVMLGDGPDMATVLRHADAAGLSVGGVLSDDADLILTGRCADPYAIVAGCVAMVLPSHSEGLPMVLLEALALGVPVIAADCPSGGVHGALGARTPHDPMRAGAEVTACGVLLPVPDRAAAIEMWAAEVGDLLADPGRRALLADGARRRSGDFTPRAARGKWRTVLARVGAA